MSDLVIPYQPFPHQKKIHSFCSKDDPTKFITVLGSRQSGKSKSLIWQAIIWGLENKEVTIWYVLPSESQCADVQRKMLDELSAMNKKLIKSSTGSRGDIKITLWNKSRIEFKTSKSENNLRGASVHYLICDESADIPIDILNSIILPSLTVTGRKAIFAGTPKGKNWFYTYYNLGLENPLYKSIKFTYKDNPLCDLDIVQAAKLSFPENVFKQEYEAEFVEGGAVFNNVEDAMTIKDAQVYDPKRTYYVGVDLAMVNDFTVITILNDFGEMVDVIRFTGKDPTFIKKSIVDVIIEWKPKKVLIETNNFGSAIYQDLTFLGNYIYGTKIEGFNTNHKSKNMIISNLISGIDSGNLKLLNNQILKNEMTDFYYDFSESGNLIYKSHDHDDMVMSLAIAYECLMIGRKARNNYSIVTV